MKQTSKLPAKKTIYLDPDDEITSVIDKILSCEEQLIVLVVPKRATVFQSVVNMKILKRSADQNSKKIVLVTSNTSVLSLAGLAGVFVANNLTSQPYLPAEVQKTPLITNQKEEVVQLADPDDRNQSSKDIPEVVEVDNSEDKIKKVEKKTSKNTKTKYGSSLKIPNFDKFRLGLLLVIGGVILLFGLGYWAIKIAPKAQVDISAEGISKNVAFLAEADVAVKEVDVKNKVLPASQKQITRTESEKVASTGQKDNGQKAGGSVTLSLNDCSQSQVTIASGTTVSTGTMNFITQVDVTLQSVRIGMTCRNSDFPQVSTAKVKVIAQSAGESYNIGAKQYSVAGHSNVSGSGTEMSGGTSEIVKVVTNSDIESAKKKIIDRQKAVADELKNSFGSSSIYVLTDSFNIKNSDFSSVPSVNSQADQVVVSVDAVYTMLAVGRNDLSSVVKAVGYDSGIDQSKQAISDDGLDKAVMVINDKTQTSAKISITSNVFAGPTLVQDEIKQAVSGKSSADAQRILESRPGIKSASVKTSPFWVGKVPSNFNKISVSIQN